MIIYNAKHSNIPIILVLCDNIPQTRTGRSKVMCNFYLNKFSRLIFKKYSSPQTAPSSQHCMELCLSTSIGTWLSSSLHFCKNIFNYFKGFNNDNGLFCIILEHRTKQYKRSQLLAWYNFSSNKSCL